MGSDQADLIIGNYVDNKLEGGKGDDYIFSDGMIDDSEVNAVLTDRNVVANKYTYRVDDSALGSGVDKIYGDEGWYFDSRGCKTLQHR